MWNRLVCACIMATVSILSQPAWGLKIEITQGQIKPMPIAVTDFVSSNTLGVEFAQVITSDLEACGLFEPISPKAFVQDSRSLQAGPRFADWRILNAQFLLTGAVEQNGNEVKVQFRLFDVFKGTQLIGMEFAGDAKKWRRLAHMVADEVYKRTTGEDGYFNTLIAYIDESGPKGTKARVRRLSIMDWDGTNQLSLTDGSNMVMTPRFSPNNKEICYLAFGKGKEEKTTVPCVHIYNLETKKDQMLGKFEGMNFAPRYSPDGKEIVMSIVNNKDGTSTIQCMDLASHQVRKLTQGGVIDTSPCFSPDGKDIVFNSDRDGKEQLYVMDRNGDNVHRISFGAGKYFQPTWSPRGDLIAFTKVLNGQFYIGVMNTDGSNERLITKGYLVEAATWSPNGRVLLFTKENRTGKGTHQGLYTIDLTGRNLRKLKTPREATDGAWSQLLNR